MTPEPDVDRTQIVIHQAVVEVGEVVSEGDEVTMAEKTLSPLETQVTLDYGRVAEGNTITRNTNPVVPEAVKEEPYYGEGVS